MVSHIYLYNSRWKIHLTRSCMFWFGVVWYQLVCTGWAPCLISCGKWCRCDIVALLTFLYLVCLFVFLFIYLFWFGVVWYELVCTGWAPCLISCGKWCRCLSRLLLTRDNWHRNWPLSLLLLPSPPSQPFLPLFSKISTPTSLLSVM